jgi:hypothetical protein
MPSLNARGPIPINRSALRVAGFIPRNSRAACLSVMKGRDDKTPVLSMIIRPSILGVALSRGGPARKRMACAGINYKSKSAYKLSKLKCFTKVTRLQSLQIAFKPISNSIERVLN